MTVDQFAEVLRNPAIQVIDQGRYQNKQGETGYYARLRLGVDQYWYSASDFDSAVPPTDVAAAIQSPSRKILRENPYRNDKGERGFEATVWYQGHAYMLGAGTTETGIEPLKPKHPSRG